MQRNAILAAAARPLVRDDGPRKADCVVVLGGDEYGMRVVEGAKLAQAGYAPYVLVDGPISLMGHESDQTIRFAVQSGFPETLFRPVWLPKGVDSTSIEARYLANDILRPQHVRSILLVTSNYHTARAARFFRRQSPWLTVYTVAAPDPFFTVDGWWKTRNGKKSFLLEWMKTITEWRGT